MVKRQRIVGKPGQKPAADSWVQQGGIDPEIEAPSPPETPEPAPQTETDKDAKQKGKASGGTYPHRISFDMDTEQYKRLKWASFDSDRPMNDILREAVEEWMNARGY
jgi:hypothetical protein